MDPVLQRFGDVTIQRLEKPKDPNKPPVLQQDTHSSSDKSKEEDLSSPDEDSGEESEPPPVIPTSINKRSLPINIPSEVTVKKFKLDSNSDITLQRNNKPNVHDEINNFSEPEVSDYEDTESEIESDEEFPELPIPGANRNAPLNESPAKPVIVPKGALSTPNPSVGITEQDDEVDPTNSSFLEKLVEGAEPSSPSEETPEIKQEPDDDYDYDIKEKLKEMGEISFETVKKGEAKPKKAEITSENEVSVVPARKPGSVEDETNPTERKVGGVNLRRNIREVMDETKLDEATLAAQRLEMERLRRVQEQQRLIRELQRQAAQERMQQKVISLLQGNNLGPNIPKPGTSGTRIGNTVLVKLPNGQTKPMTRLPKRPPFELMKMQKAGLPPCMPPMGPMGAPQSPRSLLQMKKPGGNLTPSVSIAPVSKRLLPSMLPRPHSDSDSEHEFDRRPIGPKRKSRDSRETSTTIDISSDDDCIVVSEPEDDGVDETEEDPSNSGMHTNDEFNQPDDQGRVTINVGHPENEPDIFVAPQIARIIKPHQIGGVRFLFDNVVESTGRFESSAGFGCILAHSMGLGKTLQVVTFSDIFLRHTPAKRILCIMPINTLQNWLAEYNMWLPTEEAAPNSPLQAHGEVRPRTFNLFVLNDSHKTLVARSKVIRSWRSGGGVLLIGYEQFRLLSLKKHPKSRKKNLPDQPPEDDKNKALFEEVHEALINPGPDLVICDEGHRIKNSHASISQALKQIKTKRRIVLTGYPLQNNLVEYWCMVDFVRPNYLGTKTEFSNMFEKPIMNGQCIDSTDADIKLMRYRAHVLHSLLVGFVQRRSHTVLQTALPQKEEYVLLVRMLPFQRKLYETFMDEVVRTQTVPNPLKAFAVCCKIWNHPDVLYNFLKKRAGGDAVDIDLEEVASTTGRSIEGAPATPKPRKTPVRQRKATGKGRNAAGKPAASINPFNSMESISAPPAPQQTIPNFSSLSKPESNDLLQNTFCQNSNSSFNNESFSQNPSFFDFDQTNSQFPPSYTNKSTPFNSNQQNFHPHEPNNLENAFNNQQFNLNTQQSQNNFSNLSEQQPSERSFNPENSTNLTPINPSGETNFLELVNSANNQFQTQFENQQFQNQFNPTPTSTASNNTNSFPQQNYNNQSHENNFDNYSNNQNNFQANQNYWGSPQQNTDNFFNNYNPNFSSNNANQSWIKKEECKTNMIHNSPAVSIKSETSNDSKPKINIISDIKLPPVFSTSSISSDKKINIISDIKIPIKEEGLDNKIDVKQEIMKIKNEVKSEDKAEEKPPVIDTSPLSKLSLKDSKEDGIPYDWAIELLKDYVPGCIENSAKMEILFCIIRESIALGDRLLVFSQSLITLDLIEQFLQMNIVPGLESQKWARNTSYYRLDGSTSALEREKLINEFNSNPNIHLFLVSTRAGSLGINLIGANRVVVLDASWNPCHDTQAVCRVYRYGQRKPCFVYRLVVDNCLEKKIYDRQVSKQGMSDRVVDECNPDAHLTMKDVSTLCWDDKTDEGEEKDWSHVKDNYIDVVLQKVLDLHGRRLNKEPFQHESLLVDRKEKQLSQQEKRLAKKGYEREKQAARQPSYNMLSASRGHRPIASVRPMQQGSERPSRWIPAEHWQRQGMTAQEMTLPLDVVIPTNQPEKGNIVLKAGQKVLVLKSPKGVYMQLESGKIVAIKTAIKVKGKAEDNHDPTKMIPPTMKVNPSLPVMPPQQKRIVKPFTPAKMNVRSIRHSVPNLVSHIKSVTKKVQMSPNVKPTNKFLGNEIAKAVQKDDFAALMSGNLLMGGGSSGNASSEEEEQPPPHLHHPVLPQPEMLRSKPVQPIPPSSAISTAPPTSVASPGGIPSPEEERFVENNEINKRITQLKKQISIQRVRTQTPPNPPKAANTVLPESPIMSKPSPSVASALERLQQTAAEINDANLPFQETLDSITSSYKEGHIGGGEEDDEEEEEEEEEDLGDEEEMHSIASSTDNKNTHPTSDMSDHSDEVTYVSSQQYPTQLSQQSDKTQDNAAGSNTPTADYGYNNYYGGYQPPYHAPPHHPPPPQGYGYPPQPPPYDMMNPGYPPQQYNYGYNPYPPPVPPQGHYPPPPQPAGYDYNNVPPPPQPMYSGYPPAPYPPQQYPPPPPQGMYPPPPAQTGAAPVYPDYQYPPPPTQQPYYPNT